MEVPLIIGIVFLLLITSVSLNSNSIKWQYISVILLIGFTVYIILFPERGLQGWISYRIYYTTNWLLIGTLVGTVTLLLRMSQWLAIFIGLITPMVLQYSLSSIHDISFGWGWYAIPFSVATVIFVRSLKLLHRARLIYTGCWLFVITATIFPRYMQELDLLATVDPRGPTNALEGLLLPKAVELTILYVLGTLILLFLPDLLKVIRFGRFRQLLTS